MAKIAFILLCHKDPAAIIAQAKQLTAAGDYLAIHFDGSASDTDFAQIKGALAGNTHVVFAKRVKCGWGQWSLVQASLNALTAATESFVRATHFYMVSGDCLPIKSASYARDMMDSADVDYIESYDFFDSDWIKTGFRVERLIYSHFFNERTQPRRFYAALGLQQKLGLKRKIPQDIQVMIGSQWWCLRRQTVEAVLAFVAERADVVRFFKRTWIPDETFFQTLVRHLVPGREIENRTLTFLMFSDYGMPVTFYNDQYDLLISQDGLFARKISTQAQDLRVKLGALFVSDRLDFQIQNEGRNLFAYLTSRGREGRRFAPRFWDENTSMGRGRTLYIVTCKKWHVAKALVAQISLQTGIPTTGYLFDEDQAGLPDLGGIETSVNKRGRHRRAFMRLLFDHFDQDRLMICIDPARLELIRDLYADRADVRLLDISCAFDDAYLAGHAMRVGLAGGQSPEATFTRLLPTIRSDLMHERDALRDAGFANAFRLLETSDASQQAAALAQFLGTETDVARSLVEANPLFTD
jgi:hypothetical protein